MSLLAAIIVVSAASLSQAITDEGWQQQIGCDQGNVSSLESWQQVLIRDYNTTSELGHLCFDTTQGASDGHAQSLWILGMKASHTHSSSAYWLNLPYRRRALL